MCSNVLLLLMLLPCVARCLLLLFCFRVAFYVYVNGYSCEMSYVVAASPP